MADLLAIVETWQTRQMEHQDIWRVSASKLRGFAELHNAMSRQLIKELGEHNPTWYMEAAKEAQEASTGNKAAIRRLSLRLDDRGISIPTQGEGFYDKLGELLINAARLVDPNKPKLFVDGQDRSNV